MAITGDDSFFEFPIINRQSGKLCLTVSFLILVKSFIENSITEPSSSLNKNFNSLFLDEVKSVILFKYIEQFPANAI